MRISNLTQKKTFDADVADNISSQSKGFVVLKSKEGTCCSASKHPEDGKSGCLACPMTCGISFIDDKKRVFEQVYAVKMTLNPRTWRVYRPKKPANTYWKRLKNWLMLAID